MTLVDAIANYQANESDIEELTRRANQANDCMIIAAERYDALVKELKAAQKRIPELIKAINEASQKVELAIVDVDLVVFAQVFSNIDAQIRSAEEFLIFLCVNLAIGLFGLDGLLLLFCLGFLKAAWALRPVIGAHATVEV